MVVKVPTEKKDNCNDEIVNSFNIYYGQHQNKVLLLMAI